MLLDRVKEMLIEQGEIGIVFIDIEQYESIEAEYGWAFFDEFLRRVAEVVTDETKRRFQNASIAAHRVAGSSFFVFFQTKGVEHALECNAARASMVQRPPDPRRVALDAGYARKQGVLTS